MNNVFGDVQTETNLLKSDLKLPPESGSICVAKKSDFL